MLDAGALDPSGEVVTHLVFIMTVELSSEECSDLIRLYGMNGRSSEDAVDIFQVLLFFKHDVGGILHLGQGPVI